MRIASIYGLISYKKARNGSWRLVFVSPSECVLFSPLIVEGQIEEFEVVAVIERRWSLSKPEAILWLRGTRQS